MHEHGQDSLDMQLGSIFRQGVGQPHDDAFRIAVCRRIRRRSKIRRIVLATAIAIGGLVALSPAYQLALALSDGLTQLSSVLNGVDWSRQGQALYMVTIVALLTPLVTMILED